MVYNSPINSTELNITNKLVYQSYIKLVSGHLGDYSSILQAHMVIWVQVVVLISSLQLVKPMLVHMSWAAFFSQLLSTIGSSSIQDKVVKVFFCLLEDLLDELSASQAS